MVDSPSAENPFDLEAALAARIDAAYDLIPSGRPDEVDALLAAAEAEAQAAGLRRQVIRAIYWRTHIATLHGEHFHAEQRLGEALELARAEASDALIAGLHYALGRIHFMRGQLDYAEDELGLALMHANNSGDKRRQADAYTMLGACRRNQGLLDDSWEYNIAAYTLYSEMIDEQRATANVLLDMSDIAFELGWDGEAQDAYDKAMSICSKETHPRMMSHGLIQRAEQLLLLDRLDQAAELLTQAAELDQAMMAQAGQFDLELAWGKYFHARGELERAAECCIHATRLAQNTQSRFQLAEARLQRARTLMALGQGEKALAVLSDAEVAFEMFGAQQLLAQTCCLLARFRLAEDRNTAAKMALERAQGIVAAMKQPVGRSLAAELELTEAALRNT